MTTVAPPSRFARLLEGRGGELRAAVPTTLQVNVGKLCNQTCAHCHVDAGPDRREIMERPVFELCLGALDRIRIPKVDVTGGAPELNPHF